VDRALLLETLTAACEQFSVPGAQLGLMSRGRRVVVCAGTTAHRDGQPVTRSTPFHAGSIAKSLTALVVMDAAHREELDLDVACAEQADGLWSDTPRSLLAQTSGRPNVLPDGDEELDAFVARVGAMPRVHAPGRFSYCNASWAVLDLLLRRTCGATFEELATEALPAGAAFGMPVGAALGHQASTSAALVGAVSDEAPAASAAGSRWWATADGLLDYATVHLTGGAGRFRPADVREQRRPYAAIPGVTVADSWGLGWALWDRGEHRAFGWAGYTAGHRAYLRCFPDQDAALGLMTNSAGPLLGPPGGSALFDTLLPEWLAALGVPALPAPTYPDPHRPVGDFVGSYGPFAIEQEDDDTLLLHATALGESHPVRHRRLGANTFARDGQPPGGMTLAFAADLLYLGPFAVPRA
jgi:CubicO group peptidase (beta-lactamase class C family)